MKSTISSKGQITLPVEIRRKLGLTTGSVVNFEVREGGAFLRKGHRGNHPVEAVYGTLDLGRPVDKVIEELRGPAKAGSTKRKKRPRKA